MGKTDRKTIKIILCANQKVDSVIAKEITIDTHSSQTRHHKTLIKCSFVLKTKMSCICNDYVLSLLVCWILQTESRVRGACRGEGKRNG